MASQHIVIVPASPYIVTRIGSLPTELRLAIFDCLVDIWVANLPCKTGGFLADTIIAKQHPIPTLYNLALNSSIFHEAIELAVLMILLKLQVLKEDDCENGHEAWLQHIVNKEKTREAFESLKEIFDLLEFIGIVRWFRELTGKPIGLSAIKACLPELRKVREELHEDGN